MLRGAQVRASELLDYTNYEGDYEVEMGIGREPEFRPMLENRDVLIFAWGGTVPMIAHAAGIMLDEITTTWDKWITPDERKTAKGVIKPGHVAAVRFTINGVYQGQTRIQLEHVNRIGLDAAPDWPTGNENDVYRVDIEGTPSIFAGDRVPVHRRIRPRRGRGRLPGDRLAGTQRGPCRQRSPAGLGHRAGPSADRGRPARFADGGSCSAEPDTHDKVGSPMRTMGRHG